MSDEQHMILQMVAEGKITADEGARLLEAISPKKDFSSGKDRIDDWGERISSFFSGDPSEWIQNLGSMFGTKMTFLEEQDWTHEAEGVSIIQADTTNGSIITTGTDTSQIMVHARKVVKAPREEDARAFSEHVEILVDRVDNRIQISKKHPSPPPGITVAVHFTIQCPASVDLNLRSTNGKVNVSHIEGDVNVATTNGKLTMASLSGSITAQSTNGSIHATINDLKEALELSTKNGSIKAAIDSGNAPIRLVTTNGSITLALHADFSGMLDASTRNGVIRSELPIVASHQDRRHLTGQLGSEGETPIHLKSKNGGIRLKNLSLS